MRINLLPREMKDRHQARRRTVAVLLVGLIVLGGLGVFYFLQLVRLGRVQDDLAAQRIVNAQLEQDVAELRRFDELEQEVAANRSLLADLLQDEVLWSGILRDISLVIPGSTWLTDLNGSITGAGTEGAETAAPEGQPTGLVGQITLGGMGFDHRAVALWLTRLEDVTGFVNPWLADSTKTTIGQRDAVQFSSSVDLSSEALSGSEEAP